MKHLIPLILCAPAVMATATAAAQAVRVRTVEAETGRPIGGAIVSLVNPDSQRVAQGLTSESGSVTLRGPGPGVFRLRADRIGHPGVWSDRFQLTDSLSIELVMPLRRTTLPVLTVQGSTRCQVRADGARTAALWDEIRKALSAGAITMSDQSIDLAVRRFQRYRSLGGLVTADSTVAEHRTRSFPFVSPEPATLRSGGYIQETEDGFQFHAPDAATLLSEDFLVSHCFDLATTDDRPDLVGLSFRPAPGVRTPDITGVLWVNRATSELDHLAFDYVRAPAGVSAPGIGGRIDFQRLSNGAWIIKDWYIRTPLRVAFQRRGARRTDLASRDSVVGYLDIGGSARPAGDVTVALAEASAQIQNRAAETGDVRGRILAPDGTPVPGALVAVAEADSTLTSDRNGRFEFGGLPVGPVRIRIRAIGFRPFSAELRLPAATRLLDASLVLERAAQLLDSVVVSGAKPVFEAGKMIDVERRRRQGFGRFLTRAQLHDPLGGGLDVKLRVFGRMRLAPLCGGVGYGAASTTRGEPPVKVNCGPYRLRDCFMAVYLDGALYWSPDMGDVRQPPDLRDFNPLEFEAVEIYRSVAEMPVEFSGTTGGCGVLLLWTRVG